MARVLILVALNVAVFLAGVRQRPSGGDSGGSYPEQPIQLIVPFAAGGGTDTFARIIKKAIEDNKLLPQPLVIVNIDGAGATIGSRRAKDADPDGYTLMVLHNAILTAKYSGTVDYGPEAFEPVAGTGEVGMVITVTDQSPYRDLRELMAAAKAEPNSITFGANMGALTHFAGLQLEKEAPGAAFQYTQIGGGAKRFADLKGGHIDVTGFSIEEFARFRSEGLRGLAFFGVERHPAAPDVPTGREQGFDVISNNTFYWWFSEGTPQHCVDVMAEALRQAMQTDYVRRRMAEIYCEPVYFRGEELRERLREATRRIASIDRPAPSELPNYPAIILAGIVCMATAVGLQSARRRLRAADIPAAGGEGERVTGRYGLAAGALVLVGLYVLLPAMELLDFRAATILFVTATGLLMMRFRLRWLPELLLLAQVLGFGLHWVFTHLFVVDLP